jgi:hypothetical protein
MNADPQFTAAAAAPETARVPRRVPLAEHAESLVRPARLRKALNRLAEESGA